MVAAQFSQCEGREFDSPRLHFSLAGFSVAADHCISAMGQRITRSAMAARLRPLILESNSLR